MANKEKTYLKDHRFFYNSPVILVDVYKSVTVNQYGEYKSDYHKAIDQRKEEEDEEDARLYGKIKPEPQKYIDGTNYIVCSPSRNYEHYVLKVEHAAPVTTREDIRKCSLSKGHIYLDIKNLRAYSHVVDGQYFYHLKAESVSVIKNIDSNEKGGTV